MPKKNAGSEKLVIIILAVFGMTGLIGAIILNLVHDDAQPFVALAAACIGSLTTMIVRNEPDEMEQLGRDALAGMLRQVAGAPPYVPDDGDDGRSRD